MKSLLEFNELIPIDNRWEMKVKNIKIWDIIHWNDCSRKGEVFLWWEGDGSLSYTNPTECFGMYVESSQKYALHGIFPQYGYGLVLPKQSVEDPLMFETHNNAELFGEKMFLKHIMEKLNNV